jgi:quinoprotein glucose dehydrogenase
MRLSEGPDAAPGHVQAFNIETGKLAWVFHTIPQPGESGYETWPQDVYKNTEVGAANNWSGMSVDRKRGIVYVPTGSAAFDFYGGNRKGENLFANCLLALDARNGKRIWHYQMVHHDILDRDPPAPPNLLTVTHNGKKIDAVAQVTKQGYVFVFDRENGTPLFPIEEVPMPASDIPGEEAWPTQPIPTKPAPYARQTLTEKDISPYAENREELIATVKKSRSEGPFTPLSKQGTVIFPGLDGGAEWGGAAVDPDGIIYINSNEMAWIISLNTKQSDDQLAQLTPGQRLYTTNCSACHGAERKGNAESGFPSLVDVRTRRSREYVQTVITQGKGMMPGFARLSAQEKKSLLAFLFGDEEQDQEPVTQKKEPGLNKAEQAKSGVPYRISGYTKFLDKKGYPAVAPPWGTLNAINLNTGEYVWKTILGEHPQLTAEGKPQTGLESYGGPVITAGGVLFIAGTLDAKLRAFDKKTGKLLWQTPLPAAAFATPSTYEVNGKQYIVVACGGTKLGAPKGESYVAFALP